jgi:hypothetical protein
MYTCGGRKSTVTIATRYRLDGSSVETRWVRNYLHLSKPSPFPTKPPYTGYQDFFPGDKAEGVWL